MRITDPPRRALPPAPFLRKSGLGHPTVWGSAQPDVYRISHPLSFGTLTKDPNRLLIRLVNPQGVEGFEQNTPWAEAMERAIEFTHQNPGPFQEFRALELYFVATYRRFKERVFQDFAKDFAPSYLAKLQHYAQKAFKQAGQLSFEEIKHGFQVNTEGQINQIGRDLRQFSELQWDLFGLTRQPGRQTHPETQRDPVPVLTIFEGERYEAYRARAVAFLPKPQYGKQLPLHTMVAPIEGKSVPLNRTSYGVSTLTGALNLFWQAAPLESIPIVMDHLTTLYTEIRRGKPKTDADVCQAVQKIARFHWFFAQVMPYYRGSAGIADMITKKLFDDLGIQISRWRGPQSRRADNPNQALETFIHRYGLAPDLEAYVTPLEAYIQHYPYFFEQPPRLADPSNEKVPVIAA